jgi:anti-anti-sigma regulatory factor
MLSSWDLAMPHIISLPASFDTRSLQHVKTMLIEGMEQGDVIVNASSVVRVSTPAFQLLLCAFETANSEGTRFIISNPSDMFVTYAAKLGLIKAIASTFVSGHE